MKAYDFKDAVARDVDSAFIGIPIETVKVITWLHTWLVSCVDVAIICFLLCISTYYVW